MADKDGWVVGSGDGKLWRAWQEGMPTWTPDREQATRYARRLDAETVHAEDDDAWVVEPFDNSEQPTPQNQPPRFKSAYGILDVGHGRKTLAKYLSNNHGLPVVIHATLTDPYGSDDGVSIEFNMQVQNVEVPNG